MLDEEIKKLIKEWVIQGRGENATHLILLFDKGSGNYYPYFVYDGKIDEIWEKLDSEVKKTNKKPMISWDLSKKVIGVD